MSLERARDAVYRISRWDAGEWHALLRAAALVVRVEAGLHTTSVAVLGHRLGVSFDAAARSANPPAAAPPPFTDDERRQLRAISRVLRFWPFGDTCLRQCLATGSVLRRHQPRLVIGVVREGAGVTAHSWLELADGTIDPIAPSEYEPLARAADQSTRRP